VQTQKVTSFPVVLFDSDYWRGLIAWLRSVGLERGIISATDLETFYDHRRRGRSGDSHADEPADAWPAPPS
jgi:predicted Rossmann-fold nucleotide-binding protein